MKIQKRGASRIAIWGLTALLGWVGVGQAAPPVANPTVWLTADAGVVNDEAGNVQRWEDQSGNHNHFEQSDAAKRPLLVAGGLVQGAYDYVKLPANQGGGSVYGGTMGSDFIVDDAVVVTQLAAFDHNLDGFTNAITVQLWRRNDNGTPLTPSDDTGDVILAAITFTSGEPGTLEGCFRWKPLTTPLTLSPGSYSLVVWGYTGSDYYIYNPTTAGHAQRGIRSIGTGRYTYYDNPGIWPQYPTGDYFIGCCNLQYHPSAVTVSSKPALQFDGLNDALLAVDTLNIGHPSTLFIAYQRLGNDGGYLLQNSSGPHWFIRSDGYYNYGWVRYGELPWGTTHADTMLTTATGTRVWRDQGEITQDPSLSVGTPNRLAIGGGDGQGYDPFNVRVAEMLVYDRQLSEAEILKVQNYLGQRYDLFSARSLDPEVLPVGDIGTGSVTVTMQCASPEAEIRFTTDGSNPLISSTLYGTPLSVPRGTTVKARTFLAGAAASGIATQYYGDAGAIGLPVSGAIMWLRADHGVETDTAGFVSRWRDLTGSGNDMLQTKPLQRPAWVADGMVQGESTYVTLPPNLNGNSNANGSVGSDFIVDQEVVVTQLAAFDHNRDGFSGSITVQLWQRNDAGTPLTPGDDAAGVMLEQVIFSSGAPGALDGCFRWKSLPAPRTLSPGSYTILAWGFTGGDSYFHNPSLSSQARYGIRAIGIGRNTNYLDTPGIWPQSPLSDYYIGCSNMRYHPSTSTPASKPALQFDGSDDGMLAAASLNIGHPSTIFVAYQRPNNDYGYILQNSSYPQWFIRSDGYYNNSWIYNGEIPWGSTHADTMLTTATGTRAWRDHGELTQDPSLHAGTPNRLALGGGEGLGYDPVNVKIAELVVYDRQLSEAEILDVQNYLGQRYGIYAAEVPAPEVLPIGDLGTGSVTVTMQCGTSGAQIRYTTDGSDPTSSSTLYINSISVPRGTLVKSRTFLAGVATSGISSQYYGTADTSDLPTTGAVMWLRADRGVETDASGFVSRWRDLTGNGNDLVQATPWQRPALTQAFSQNGGYAIRSLETGGLYNHAGTLGADFVVTNSIDVSELGAYDHMGDGLSGSLTVQLWSRDDHGTPDNPNDDTADTLLAEMEFTNASPGSLVGSSRYKPLLTPVTLPPGAYSILAWGFTEGNYYRNSSDGYWNEDSIRFVNNSRYSSANGTWPTSMDSHPVKYNGAGNFRYQRTAVPSMTRAAVSFDGADDGLLALPTSNLTRPSTLYVVFDQSDYGPVLQNTNTAGYWLIRSEGAYSNGWVSNPNRYLGYLKTHIAGMTSETGATRFYLNGEDWTVNPNVGDVPPGRLGMGASGFSFDPSRMEVAEVMAFSRVLSTGERWQVENYLSNRYRSKPVALPAVAIAPASNYGSGDVTVTLTRAVADSEIRYTTDGTTPTAASTLYNGAFSAPRNTRVRAIAVLGTTQSDVISETYYGSSGGALDLPVAGAKMWLRANAGVEVDAAGMVSTWRDLTGNGNDMVQELAELRPQLLTDGYDRANLNALRVPMGDGNGNWSGSLGEDFVVTQEMDITHLGAFDHLRDGFEGTITVQLWSRNDNGTPGYNSDDTAGTTLAELTFTAASPGTLEGQTRFKELPSPLHLMPGNYTVLAWGYTGANLYYEGTRATPRTDLRFHFSGNSRYHSSAGTWPATIDSGFLDYDGAANFKVAADAAQQVLPSVAFDGLNDGLLGVAGMNFSRPSTVLMVFRKEGSDSGYMLQNSAGGNWWFRNDGFYSDGWVRYDNFLAGHFYLAAMASDTTATRAYLDGREVTNDPYLTSSAPGRLAMGGGSGQNIDPVMERVVELVVYDHILNATEMWQVQNYLARKNGLYTVETASPEIFPVSGYGTGDVEVTMSSASPSAQIRYTTNGSNPLESSTLYTGAFSVPRNSTVKAKAFLTGSLASSTTSNFYGLSSSHPLPVTDAALWLRADSGLEVRDDGSISRWKDISGNGRDLVSRTLEKSPRLVTSALGGSIKTSVPLPPGLTGGTTHAGSIGAEFVADEALEITHLGVFDSGNNGISGTLTVRLHRVSDNGTPGSFEDDTSAEVLATQVFTNADPGTLDGSSRFIQLASPLSLSPGRYLVQSSGWTGADSYMESPGYDMTYQAGISYPSRSRYNTSPDDILPGTIVNDNRYLAAASFKFRKAGAVAVARDAVRFDGVDDGMLGPQSYLLGRPSTIFMVFNQLTGTDGRLLQSGNGHNFLLGPHIGTDGLYADGWVAQHTILRNQHSHVVGIYEGDQTRYFYNGQELTQVSGYTGVLGRLALGGGEGAYFQPCNADLAELIIYHRALSDAERQQVTSALAVKYDLPLEPILPPVAMPDGGFYQTGQTLAYSHPLSGVEIRYTTDGSEPTASSTLCSGSLVVASSGTYKAKAFKADYLPSSTKASVFTIDPLATHMPQRSALQVWLRAGVNTETSDGAVSVWHDLSGNGMDATQPTPAYRPTLDNTAIGGAPGLVFDGTNDSMSLPKGFADFTQGLTAIVVARPNPVGTWPRFFDLGNGYYSDNIYLAREGSNNNLIYGVSTNNRTLVAYDTMLPASNVIYTVTQLSSGSLRIHHNGTQVAEDTSFPLPTQMLRRSNLIGATNFPGWHSFYSGAISEIIIYNRALNDQDRETLEAAVRERYGIASTSTATVAFSPDSSQLYPAGADVTLTCVTPDSQIHYTLDGTAPDENSPLYADTLHLAHSARVRARAFTTGFNPSPFSEATYLIGQPPSSGDGFLGTYYDNEDFTGASLIRVDPTIDFAWGYGSPDPAIDPDYFSVRWTGKIVPRFSENYTFHASSDDGQRLWVDLNHDGDFDDPGELLIDDWNWHWETEVASAPVALVAGQLYDMKMEMFEGNNAAAAHLRWSSFSQPKAAIPQSQAFSNAQFSQTVSTPVITPVAGTYTSAVNVTLATATTGATIYYTTDGSIPDEHSQVYGGTFPIGADATVRARAYKAGFNPSGAASAAYHIDAQPPIISQFAWQGAPINNGETFTNKGTLSAQATDNQGVARAEFYYMPGGSTTPLLIGTDTYPPDGLSATWDIATISDGAFTVKVRVYDVSGTWSETSREINVALATPSAPVIASPASGVTVQDPVVPMHITAQPNVNIHLLRDDALIFSGYASYDGSFNYSPSLPTGSSVFKAVAINRAGPSPDSNAVTVNRVREFPQLALSFGQTTLIEGESIIGTVSIPTAEAHDLTVQISTNKASRMIGVNPVFIPAGATSNTFTLGARQDSEIQLLTTVMVSATANEHRSAGLTLDLGDDDYPALTLTIDQSSVSENHGTVVGVIRRSPVTDRSVRVSIQNSNPAKAGTPEFVDIPANEAEISFAISIINNTLVDGNQMVDLRGVVMIGGTSVALSPMVELEVRDNDGPSLAMELSNSFIPEGSSVNATLRRSGAANTAALVVGLSQSPTAQLSTPATVTIPAGSDHVTFTITAFNNVTVNGTRNVTLRTSAASYTDGLTQITVTDESKAELTVSNLSAPALALTETYAAVSYQINNFGSLPATGPFFERIFLSKDLSPGADDILVRQLEMTGELAAGGYYVRNTTVLVPRATGTFYLIVTVDPGNMVPELNEDNNTTVLMQPIEVRAAYSATVQTAPEVVPANTPIVFTGSATKENGMPAAFSMVNIHIKVNNTNRIISAITNSLGQFSVTWTPLAFEGGVYTIGAVHPGTDTALPQDSFEILTMGLAAPSGVTMNEAQTVVVQATLNNPNGRDLHGLAMSVSGTPVGLTITPMLPNTILTAGAEMQVPITVSASAGFSGSGAFPLTVTTTEGVTMQALMYVNISLLTPSLSFSVNSMDASVLRGSSKSVSFTVTNNGGLATGPVTLLLPDLPWMTLACASPLPSIPPGGSADVSLLLAPDTSVPLTQYSGSMAMNPANGAGRSLGYQFRVVSDLKGDLTIDVVDELFFFTAEAPKLAGAQVVVRDAISSAQVASLTTGSNGVAAFTDLPEGWYRIDVSAAEHDSFSGNYYVNAGQNNTRQVFISKQLVKYSWKVEEVALQDVYRVTIETKFETNVPAPVVTATPSAIDVADLVALGQSKIVNITLENHGFIAAQNSRFRFSEHPFYSFTPLVSNIGTIPAKSSLVVPVTVRRTGVFGDNGEIITENSGMRGMRTKRAPGGGAAVPCGAAAAVDYNYPCGEWLIEKAVVLAISGVQGSCSGGGTSAYTGYIGGFYSGGSGPGSGGPGGGVGASNGSVSFSSPDPCLAVCLARATVDCAIGFTPAGCFYNLAQCVFTFSIDGCIWTGIGCGVEYAGKTISGYGPWVNGANCIYSYAKCFKEAYDRANGKNAPNALEPGQFILDTDFRTFAPEVAEAWSRCEPVLRLFELHYGCIDLVLAQGTEKGALAMLEFAAAALAGSPGGVTINEDESIAIFALALDAGLDHAQVQRAIDRWNRTVDYRSRGIREIVDVPAGDSTDFVDDTAMKAIAAEIVAAYDTSRGKGFIEPFHEFLTASANLRQTLQGNQGGTCATVKIQLSQDVVMTRTAFRATLELENQRNDGAITQVGFNMQIRDELGQPSEDLFNVAITKLTGLAAIDGTGEIPSSSTGSAQWTLIPRDTAAQENTRHYTVGGVIHYIQNGTEFNIPVENVPITVRPDASLALKYFHQRDVLGDDPHTDAIEPSIPYKLAVMVENHGHGDANNLRIISGQPLIVDNEKGLFIDFKVFATEVDGQPLSPSLTAELGTLSPGQKKIATWYMTSTLQGLFTSYSATFEHISGLGDSRISLLQSVEIHEMIRMVRAQGGLDDGAPDFLTNDVADANDYPDTIHYSNGGTDIVTVRQTGNFSAAPAPGNLTITLNTGAFNGWSYIRLPDPSVGNYRLVSATREDGRILPMDFNVWQSDRTFIGGGRRPLYENILHLVDNDSSGVYTLVFAALAERDITPPSSFVDALPPLSTVNIPVTWRGSDDQSVSHYDVYVSANGGAYDLWKQSTSEGGGLFVGNSGSTYSFYSVATDQAGNRETKTAAAEATTEVAMPNLPPVITAISNASINEGGVFTTQAVATDPDGDTSSIRFSIGTDRPGVVIDPITGVIRWNTSETDGGAVAHVIVVATDSGFPAAVANSAFTITVNEVNIAPTISQVGPQTIQSIGVLLVDLDAADGDSPAQTLTFSLTEAPAGATIDPVNGVIHWAPTIPQADHVYLFTATVTDNGTPALSASTSFSVTVLPHTDRAPVFTKVPVVLWLKGKSYSLTLSATDADGDRISLSANTAATPGATFSDRGNGSATFSWNTTGAALSTYNVPVTATANGASTNATLRIKVENDELYWQWAKSAFGDLEGIDLALLAMDADPDLDGRTNVQEMAFLTNPLAPDKIPLKINTTLHPTSALIHLNLHKLLGSEQYLDFDVSSTTQLNGPWQRADKAAWSVLSDAHGDDDNRPETESLDIYIDESHPTGPPSRKFYRIESTPK